MDARNPRLPLLLSNMAVVIAAHKNESKIGVNGDHLVEHKPGWGQFWTRYRNGDDRNRTVTKMTDDLEELMSVALMTSQSTVLHCVFMRAEMSADEGASFELLFASLDEMVGRMQQVIGCLAAIDTGIYGGEVPALQVLATKHEPKIKHLAGMLASLRARKDQLPTMPPLTRMQSQPSGADASKAGAVTRAAAASAPTGADDSSGKGSKRPRSCWCGTPSAGAASASTGASAPASLLLPPIAVGTSNGSASVATKTNGQIS